MFTISLTNLNIIFAIPLLCVCCCAPWCAMGAAVFWMLNFGIPYEWKNVCTYPSRLILIFCFVLSLCSILLLPIDLSIKNVFNDYLVTFIYSIFTQMFYFIIIFFVVVVIPFFICFYESQNPDGSIITQVWQNYSKNLLASISNQIVFK